MQEIVLADGYILTDENYYSLETKKHTMSFHDYLNYVGGNMVVGCEAKAVAIENGEWEEPVTKPLLVGGYVDAYFEGSLDKWKKEHPECFTQKGELKAEFKQAEKMIARCNQDEYFMQTMSGEKQTIFTANWAGTTWRCKLDSYIPHVAIVDLKTSANIHKAWRIADAGYVSFVEAYNYEKQLALYQKIVEINTGEKLPCYISVVTKEDEPEICVINIDQMTLDHALNSIEMNMASVLAVKNGEAEPIRCEKCDYCKRTKKLTGAIAMEDLINE